MFPSPPGRATREASAGLALVPERVQREQQAHYNAIIAAVRDTAQHAFVCAYRKPGQLCGCVGCGWDAGERR